VTDNEGFASKVPENSFSFTPGFSPVMEARENWKPFQRFHRQWAVKVVENAEVGVMGRCEKPLKRFLNSMALDHRAEARRE
jgi:hypothetical protein